METQNIPTSFKFNQKDVKKLAKRRQLSPGWYAFLLSATKRDQSKKKGTLGLQQTCFPLKDPKDAATKSTPTIRNTAWLPINNPNMPGHKAGNTVGMNHSYLMALELDADTIEKFADALDAAEEADGALDGAPNMLRDLEELPDYPRKNESGVFVFKGEEIEGDDKEIKQAVAAAHEEVTGITIQMLMAAWQDPSLLDNFIVFGEVFDNNGFMNVRSIKAALPDGEELLPQDKWDGGEVEDDEEGEAAVEEEQPKTRKPATKAPATKKAPAKKKR